MEKFIIENPSFRELFFIKCAGIEEESTREYPPCKSFYTVMEQLGFFPSRQAYHPKIIEDAKRNGLIPIHWQPNFIQAVRNLNEYDTFITPYQSVFEKLGSKWYTNGKELLLTCDPIGIGLDCCPANAAEKMWPWVRSYFNNMQ